MEVVGAENGNGIGLIAVQVGQGIKGLLLAGGKQPVNRALFIGLDMVFIKIIQKIAPDSVAGGFFRSSAQGVSNELQVFFQGSFTESNTDKINKAGDNVIAEVILCQYGDYIIPVNREGLIY